MKAEERKELETNVLADRVGKAIERVKGGPSRRTMFWVVALLVVGIGVFFYMRGKTIGREKQAQGWLALAAVPNLPLLERHQVLGQLIKEYGKEKAGFAAAFQASWSDLDGASRNFRAASLFRVLQGLDRLTLNFQALEDESKDDPLLHAEAKYRVACIYEMRAVLDSEVIKGLDTPDGTPLALAAVDSKGVRKTGFLEAARETFEAIASSYPETIYGQLSAKRLESYKNDMQEMRQLYLNLATSAMLGDQLTNAERDFQVKARVRP